MANTDILSNILKIIERDSKTSTYKFALLRGVIEIVQENSPFIQHAGGRVFIPTGLLIEKWLLYYYPILECGLPIPQINGNANLKFEVKFKELIAFYKNKGGFSVFYNDLKVKGIPRDVQKVCIDLCKLIRDTITKMPMRYIGNSLGAGDYSIFNYENPPIFNGIVLDFEILIKHFGLFSIPKEYYEAFKYFGSFLVGQDSLIMKWAEFSVNASKSKVNMERVINEALKSPVTERNVAEVKDLFNKIVSKEKYIYCVWTGKKLMKFDLDHVIPFSIWKNNDSWNLLPASSTVNNQKRDKVPSPILIEKQKELILGYWKIIQESNPQKFKKEIQVSLLGEHPITSMDTTAIHQLKNNCNYLINDRGFEEWMI